MSHLDQPSGYPVHGDCRGRRIRYIATGFRGAEDLLSLPPLIVGSMIGAHFGVQIREVLPERAVRGVLAVFIVVVAQRLLSEALSFSKRAVSARRFLKAISAPVGYS